MKGGENLHFRHVLITGLLVGAALLLPNQTFAEKNKFPGQQKTEQIASPKKTMTVSERTMPNKGRVKKQAVVQKQTAISANLPKQANGNGSSRVKKPKKAVKTKQAPMVKEKTKRLPNNKQSYNPVVEIKDEPAIAMKLEPREEGSHLSIGEKIPNSEKRNSPTSKEPIPVVNLGTSPTQRTGNSAGPSNDRINMGLYTIGSVDKWFEWNNQYKIKKLQPFFSRYVFMRNQWVNAPPSPPPKGAPFFKNVIRS